ncbi:growth-regulating factor 4-like [Amaranthus tricolor]|uniref:growth-regulating factor 4-like n=1 Tax=Amaranthus tricolor TaxID=29722 RepID=UPI00258C5B93|nr:growth-regulating factor 4-like [Amaranthus tricolor]
MQESVCLTSGEARKWEKMNSESTAVSPSIPLFTLSQWKELEHQALIFKYMLAGHPVPPDLVLPIQNSLSSSSFLHLPSYGYCSRENTLYGIGYGYGYGKKVDPEPGRCRRTDGKKWRCSKEAYPDSKYCERHMNRGRNRSRKLVESSSCSSSSTTSSCVPALSLNQSEKFPHKFDAFASISNPNQTQYESNSIPYAIPTKHYSRHLEDSKPEAGQHRSLSQCTGSNRSLLIDSAMNNTWSSPSPQMSSLTPSKLIDSSSLHNYHRQSFDNIDFDTSLPVKQSSQSTHPFFELWPNSREAWSGLGDESTNQVGFSSTQLSISMGSSDFSTSQQSPQEP